MLHGAQCAHSQPGFVVLHHSGNAGAVHNADEGDVGYDSDASLAWSELGGVESYSDVEEDQEDEESEVGGISKGPKEQSFDSGCKAHDAWMCCPTFDMCGEVH